VIQTQETRDTQIYVHTFNNINMSIPGKRTHDGPRGYCFMSHLHFNKILHRQKVFQKFSLVSSHIFFFAVRSSHHCLNSIPCAAHWVSFDEELHFTARSAIRTEESHNLPAYRQREREREALGFTLAFLRTRTKAKTMKFCKNLQRVVEISDPAYSAFFVNYRMLSE
jgi:hypothetical protein